MKLLVASKKSLKRTTKQATLLIYTRSIYKNQEVSKLLSTTKPSTTG